MLNATEVLPTCAVDQQGIMFFLGNPFEGCGGTSLLPHLRTKKSLPGKGQAPVNRKALRQAQGS
jgi:hypothetical protein